MYMEIWKLAAFIAIESLIMALIISPFAIWVAIKVYKKRHKFDKPVDKIDNHKEMLQ